MARKTTKAAVPAAEPPPEPVAEIIETTFGGASAWMCSLDGFRTLADRETAERHVAKHAVAIAAVEPETESAETATGDAAEAPSEPDSAAETVPSTDAA